MVPVGRRTIERRWWTPLTTAGTAGPAIFPALLNDRPLPGQAVTTTARVRPSNTATGNPTRGSALPTVLTVCPDAVGLQVINAAGAAGAAMNSVNALDFAITNDDLPLVDQVQSGVTVRYSAGNEPAALTVAAAVPGAVLQEAYGLGRRVQLVLSSDFDGTSMISTSVQHRDPRSPVHGCMLAAAVPAH